MREWEIQKHKKEIFSEWKDDVDELDLFNKLALKMTEKLEGVVPKKSFEKWEEET